MKRLRGFILLISILTITLTLKDTTIFSGILTTTDNNSYSFKTVLFNDTDIILVEKNSSSMLIPLSDILSLQIIGIDSQKVKLFAKLKNNTIDTFCLKNNIIISLIDKENKKIGDFNILNIKYISFEDTLIKKDSNVSSNSSVEKISVFNRKDTTITSQNSQATNIDSLKVVDSLLTKKIDTLKKEVDSLSSLKNDSFSIAKTKATEYSETEYQTHQSQAQGDNSSQYISQKQEKQEDQPEITYKEDLIKQQNYDKTQSKTSYEFTTSQISHKKSYYYDPVKIEYNKGLQLYRKKQYRKAISIFESLLNKYPNHKLAPNFQYWIGECLFKLKDYNRAINYFRNVYLYTNSWKKDDAAIMIAISYYKMGDIEKARAEFKSFIYKYPDSEYIKIAKHYLKKIGE